MEASEDHKTSKTRASTPASNGQLAVANWSPSPAANSEQGAKLTASSTEISTESDSEKDAAEAYNGAGSHQTGIFYFSMRSCAKSNIEARWKIQVYITPKETKIGA